MSVFYRAARAGLASVAMSLAIAPAATAAQVAPASPAEPPASGEIIMSHERRTDIIVTGIRAVQLPEESGQAITVLDRATIERRQTRVVSDLLAQTPGVVVSRNGGVGQTTAVRIRGAEDAQTLVLIDGVRVNDPSTPAGSFDFGNLLVGNIERIEVLRGPNSVPWGSQALGGVVNVVTAAPRSGFEARLLGEYGTRDATTLVGNVSGTAGPVAASLGAGYFRDDGVSAFKFGTEPDGYRQYAANGRVEVTLSDAVSLDLRGYYADSRVSYDGFLSDFSFGDTGDYAKTRQAFGYAGVNADLFDGNLRNRFGFSIADTSRDAFSSATATIPTFVGRGLTERVEYQGDATPVDGLRLVFGAEHEFSRFRDARNRFTTTIDSGYLQAVVEPTDTITLTGGVRVDRHREFGTEVTASGNIAWQPRYSTIIRASYGEGFKAPTLFQLFSAFGNEDLRPERAQSFDLGIEQQLLDDRLRVGVTAFHRDTVDQIDFFSCFASTRPLCANGRFGFFDNIARTRAKGIEATLVARPTQLVTLTANYTLLDAKNRLIDTDLLRRPRHNLYAALDYQRFGWRIGGDVRLASDSRDVDFVTFRPTTLDGYALVGLRASIEPVENIELFGRIENLFDTDYETVSGYGTEGRSIRVGVRARL